VSTPHGSGFVPDAAYEAAWQVRVARMLTRLLEHGAAKGLPAASWRVTAGAPQLIIQCNEPWSSPEADLRAWKSALTALAGPPDSTGERPDAPNGEVFAFAVWEDYQQVRVNLNTRWDDDTVTGRADRALGGPTTWTATVSAWST